MSPTTPSGRWTPDITPSAESLASRSPESSAISMPPSASRAAATNSGPFEASRAAAVAITRTSSMPIIAVSRRKRFRAVSAFSTPALGSLPVETTPLPSPQSDFSLKAGIGARSRSS